MAKKKTIQMLLYDGTLNGVMNISDSAWDSGKMYSAPRESINKLISLADCKKYGVYLLLSDQQVYVGQASDLERRTKQHLSDKDWWTRIIMMTTKDNSFNASDIDYLESSLITLAEKAGKSDSDNKKKGNPQKVSEFRQAELEQYLEEALFLLELIGIKIFKKDSKKTGTRPHPRTVPPLPSNELKIGEFVYTAMQNLSESGFCFDLEKLSEMTTSNWSKATFHTKHPFLKLFVPGETDNKGVDGRIRYKTAPFSFGKQKVLVSKEWYERQRKLFIDWYESLE